MSDDIPHVSAFQYSPRGDEHWSVVRFARQYTMIYVAARDLVKLEQHEVPRFLTTRIVVAIWSLSRPLLTDRSKKDE